jgi:hypothetical protein
MPTAEQMQLRQENIAVWVDELSSANGDTESVIKRIPDNLKVPVLAGALANGSINAEFVAPKIANDVAMSFIKDTGNRSRDAAADKGTEVHALAEAITNGEVVTVPPALENHIKSWQQFREFYDLEFVKTEFTVWSPTHDYAGTGDFLALSRRFPELGLICGDYKTSVSGIWPDIALQLAAIRYADFIGNFDLTEDHETLQQIKRYWGVQITADGYRVVPVKVNEAVFRVFLSAINVARWKRDYEQFALGKSEFVPRGAL